MLINIIQSCFLCGFPCPFLFIVIYNFEDFSESCSGFWIGCSLKNMSLTHKQWNKQQQKNSA